MGELKTSKVKKNIHNIRNLNQISNLNKRIQDDKVKTIKLDDAGLTVGRTLLSVGGVGKLCRWATWIIRQRRRK